MAQSKREGFIDRKDGLSHLHELESNNAAVPGSLCRLSRCQTSELGSPGIAAVRYGMGNVGYLLRFLRMLLQCL